MARSARRTSRRGRRTASAADLSTVEGLASYAKSKGLDREVSNILQEKPKMSFLQRLSAGLGAFNTANALSVGQKRGIGRGLLQYPVDVAKGLGGALTGTNYQPDRKAYKDIAGDLGIENGVAKFGVGFIGDVLLDPTTYFGGAIARGAVAGVRAASNVGLRGIGRVAPATETGLRMAGGGLKDALGKAFVSDYKATKGAQSDILKFISKRERARLGLAASNLNRLGTGVLTPDQQAELALKLVAGKRAEFSARSINTEAKTTALRPGKIGSEFAKSDDPVVQAAIDAQRARTTKFGKQLDLENPYETYFPFIRKDKLDKFVREIQSRGIRVGSENYRKEFKNLLTDDALELDPAKAFFTSEEAQVIDRMTRDFLEGFVKKVGKGLDEFQNADEALAQGFRVIKDKGQFGTELGYLNEADARLIKNLISPEFQTINTLAKATGFDAITNLFKRSVTGLFLPFHVRNFTSGIIQNFEVLGVGALNPKAIAAGQKLAYHLAKGTVPKNGVIEVAGKTVKFSKVFKEFADRFGTDTFYQNDFLQAVEGGQALKQVAPMISKASLKTTAKTAGLGADAIPFRAGRAVGQFIEHQQKATAYMVALSQGKSIQQALALAERAGFDYRALTAFESQILRRIIPFYSFTRKNIELQLKVLGENPQRINQVLAFFGNIGDRVTPEENEALPDYIKRALGIKISDTPDGLKQYISSFGTPIEAFATLINENPVLMALSMTNPVLKTPIEIGIGKDSFRQRDLKEVYDAKEYKLAPQFIKDLLEIKEVKKPILKKLPNGEYVTTGERTQYVADPVKLLIARSLFTSRGATYLDTVFGGDVEGFAKWVKLTTGLKPQQIDLEMQKSLKERDERRALEDLLQKLGYASVFSKAYVPKD